MKIAFHLNCLAKGGAERVVTNLAGKFADEGFDVIVATEWTDEDEYTLSPKVRRVHVGLDKEDENKGRFYKYFKRVKNLHKFMQDEKPDVVIAFARLALFRALMAKKGTDSKVIISVRIDPYSDYVGLRNKFFIWKYMKRADGAVFQTDYIKGFFDKQLKDKSKIILNPITPKYIEASDIEVPKEKIIANAARLVDFKNQVMLVHAFAIVHKKYPDYKLLIYGPDGGEGTEDRIKEAIKEENLEGSCILMGGSDSLEKDLKKAEIFAYSSDYEGMPNALMEAMALGLCCISTDCRGGGARQIIRNKENGLLVPVGDKDALADGIIYLIEHKDVAQKYADNAKKIKDIASIDAVYKEWNEYIREVVGKK